MCDPICPDSSFYPQLSRHEVDIVYIVNIIAFLAVVAFTLIVFSIVGLILYCKIKGQEASKSNVKKQIEQIEKDKTIKFVYIRGLPYKVAPENPYKFNIFIV